MILLELVAQQENLLIPGDCWGFSRALRKAKKFTYSGKWSPRKKSNIAHDANSEKKKSFQKLKARGHVQWIKYYTIINYFICKLYIHSVVQSSSWFKFNFFNLIADINKEN